MSAHLPIGLGAADAGSTGRNSSISRLVSGLPAIALLLFGCLRGGQAQTSVLTVHNDLARTGQNLTETTLTPANVNAKQFGKLFSQPIFGNAHTQVLYVPKLSIPGKGVHNVAFLGTTQDLVYAFDADNNGGVNASPLWSLSLPANVKQAGTYQTNFGVTGTPVIDLSTNTMYLVSSEKSGTTAIDRLHALDITTGAEKFGGPILIQGTVHGTGSGSSGGTLSFDPAYHRQRPGLLLLNGVVYVALASFNDTGPWHGWLFSYSAATLKQIDIYCTSANSLGAGIWMSGAGLAADIPDASKPYGRMFLSLGNGTYAASSPYTNTMSYGMSVLNLDLTGGVMTVKDEFTPYDEFSLNAQDGDLGSGGPVLLPPQTLASGKTYSPVIQVGKSGMFYILDRNKLGGFNSDSDQVVQEVQTPESGTQSWGAGIWGSPAYWNQHIFYGGTNPQAKNPLTSYSFAKGVLSTTPTSQSIETFGYPGPTPSISANGTKDAIVWVLDNSAYGTGPGVLLAYDATNLADTLYSSNTNPSRDNPGLAVTYTMPTIADGKVFVASGDSFSVYGLLNATPTVAAPVFTPGSTTFADSQTISISDSTPGTQVYYTTDQSVPTINSTLYTGPITITSTQTIQAIATADGYLQSPVSSATYTDTGNTLNPQFSLATGTYAGTQTLKISDSSAGSKIYYTVDGSTPTTSSPVYKAPLTLLVTQTVQAFAVAPKLAPSAIVSAVYTIGPAYTFDFSQGFSQAASQMQFNGSTDLDDFRLQLTNGGNREAGSAFYLKPVNIQAFTTDFQFQLSNPNADGITFTIQNMGPTAVGGLGGLLGYEGIGKSVAIKFDLYNNLGEGPNSTGLYTDGANPILPSISLVGTGIDLHSGNFTYVHLTYDGTYLTMTLLNPLTGVIWSHSFTIDIPSIVGGNTAYVGFTGGTGEFTASQKVTYWTYTAGPPSLPNYPNGFDGKAITRNGATFNGSALQLTDGGTSEAASAYFSAPVGITSFTTDFDFSIKAGAQVPADGFTFVIQNDGPNALGGKGSNLGYSPMPHSLAVKFDVFNNIGEGNDSTGVYSNGQGPTLPDRDLSGTNIVLSSGHLMHAHISYNGTVLAWTIADKTLASQPSVTNTLTINIPQTIGSSSAYVGFTGATGGNGSIQQIFNWTVTNP